MKEDAQVAMLDAIAFMVMLTLASAIVLGSSGVNRPVDSQSAYCNDFSYTLLSMDLSVGGSSMTTAQALCHAPLLDDNTAHWVAVFQAASKLIRPGTGWAVESSSSGNVFFVSGPVNSLEELPDDRSACQTEFHLGGEKVLVTVYVWGAA